MGNLVTNRINFERRDGALGIEAFAQVLLRLTPVSIADIREQFAKAAGSDSRVWAPFDMGLASPQPEGLDLPEKGDMELGLAILSTPQRDLVSAFWECRDPIFNDMPPHLVRTAHSVQVENGLQDLDPRSRLDAARIRFPDDLAAGEAALKAYEATGQFEGLTWRKQSWGTRAHAEEVGLWFEKGNLCAKFDTVNEGPGEWLADLAKVLPDYHFAGVSYDADMDYSLHFVTDEPGELSIEEGDDADQVLKARAFVAGMTVDELLEEDRLCHGEDEDDEPEEDDNDDFQP